MQMRLMELEQFNPITVQCHDNPDADSMAAGFGLYTYFKEKGKDVRLVYAGNYKIQKKNLLLMVENLHIPITHIEDTKRHINGLLITVDCQYGEGNVTRLFADEVAVIDHHEIESRDTCLQEIHPELGSCSTLIWKMMKEEGFCFENRRELETALYYGLYSDTDCFSEIQHPLDKEMRDVLLYDRGLMNLFKNSNISIKELVIAGQALLNHIYSAAYRYAIIKAEPCDPNVLGFISDFMIQVDMVDTCVVYNEAENEYKFSVRSCIDGVCAKKLAEFVSNHIGSGGGHMEKAGGVIKKNQYEEVFSGKDTETYFKEKMDEYFEKQNSLS